MKIPHKNMWIFDKEKKKQERILLVTDIFLTKWIGLKSVNSDCLSKWISKLKTAEKTNVKGRTKCKKQRQKRIRWNFLVINKAASLCSRWSETRKTQRWMEAENPWHHQRFHSAAVNCSVCNLWLDNRIPLCAHWPSPSAFLVVIVIRSFVGLLVCLFGLFVLLR